MMYLSRAAAILNGQLLGRDVLFNGVSTDSRTLAAGDLFIALQGDNFDGAAFVKTAAQAGAVAALVNVSSYQMAANNARADGGASLVQSTIPLLLVNDTKLALGGLAAHWRAQFPLPLAAVTGSNGKTTVKEMLASILRVATNSATEGSTDAVLATHGNLNNDIGMPLTLLKLRAKHRYAVIEMGMNHTGEIDYLSRIACPDVAIVNNAGSAHLAGLGSIAAVARAKGEIFAGLSVQGTAIINADDNYASLWRELVGDKKIIDFALDHPAAVTAQWQMLEYGANMDVRTPQSNFSVQLQVPGAHNVRNALAAIAAAVGLNISNTNIVAGLENFLGVAGRMQRHVTAHGAQLIDDSYNANPASLRAALRVLTQATGTKILVLGDMGELGAEAAELHGQLGAEARELGIDELLALGELTRHTVREFGAGAQHFASIEDLLAVLNQKLDAKTTLLVKGSRFMRMERVVHHCISANKPSEGMH